MSLDSRRDDDYLLGLPAEPDDAIAAELDATEPAFRLDRDFIDGVAASLAHPAPATIGRFMPTRRIGRTVVLAVAASLLCIVVSSAVLMEPAVDSGRHLLPEPPVVMRVEVEQASLAPRRSSTPGSTTAQVAEQRQPPLRAPSASDSIALWMSDREAAAALQTAMNRLRRERPGIGITRMIFLDGRRGFRANYPDRRLEYFVYDVTSHRVVLR